MRKLELYTIANYGKAKKGNWLLIHTEDYATKVGEAITEEEAKSLLMRYAPDDYEKRFEEIPEA